MQAISLAVIGKLWFVIVSLSEHLLYCMYIPAMVRLIELEKAKHAKHLYDFQKKKKNFITAKYVSLQAVCELIITFVTKNVYTSKRDTLSKLFSLPSEKYVPSAVCICNTSLFQNCIIFVLQESQFCLYT